MSFFFGKKNKVKPEFTGLQTQTSASTLPVPLVWGETRVAPNIIWQGEFQSHKHDQKTGKGGGSSDTYTYSASFQLGLCEGPIHGVTTVWKDQSKFTSYADPKLGFSLFTGTYPQAPWGHLTGAFAIGYPGTAHLDVADYDLGSSNTLSQHSFCVQALLWSTGVGATIIDADPSQIIDQFLVTLRYSVGFPASSMDYNTLYSGPNATTTGDSAMQTYCRAMGFGMSPNLDSQESASDILDRWTKLMNTALVWTGYSLQFIPYGDATITANGVTYLPPTAVQFAITDNDFDGDNSQDPVLMDRVDPQDAKNVFKITIKNRANDYNNLPVEWRDQALIDTYGEKPDSAFNAMEICDSAMATKIVALMAQRQAYIRNTFKVTVPVRHCRILPMDVGTIQDAVWGTVAVRCTKVEETDTDEYQLELEEFPATTGSSDGFSTPVTSNTPVNTAVAAGPINPPIIFEPPSTLSAVAQVWAAISGGNGTTADLNWGGAYVWVSADAGATYQQIGTQDTASRMGKTTTTLAVYGGVNPDTVNSVGVDLTESTGSLLSVTAPEAANNATLSYLGGEFISYEIATLTSAYHYMLGTELFRGLYGTTPGSHASGVDFARLDGNIFKYNLPAAYIGVPLLFKFQSFNIFGSGVQDLATCTAYPFTPSGTGYGGGAAGVPLAPTGVGATGAAGQNIVTWTANPPSDNVTFYRVYRAPGPSGLFGASTLIASTASLNWSDTAVVPGNVYTYYVVAVNVIGASTNSTPGHDATPTNAPGVVRLYGGLERGPNPLEVMFDIEMIGDEHFPAGTGWLIGTEVAPGSNQTYTLTLNGVTVGTGTINSGSTSGTWTVGAPINPANGDRLKLTAPSAPDTASFPLSYTILGTRS